MYTSANPESVFVPAIWQIGYRCRVLLLSGLIGFMSAGLVLAGNPLPAESKGMKGASMATSGGNGKPPVSPLFEGIGRLATPAEIRAWDIDVRPDFKGLPRGRGSVFEGQEIWEAKCASCHGVFGEANDTFTPIATGIVRGDIAKGRVSSLTQTGLQRSTLMKLPTVSTLWDYINRAMPWTAPKTLSANEVYALTAYILNLGDVVPDNFILSEQNIASVQAKMPNRNGMTREHGMWLPDQKPDVSGIVCMQNCRVSSEVISFLPDYAKNAHGNLQTQNRSLGATRGLNTETQKNMSADKLGTGLGLNKNQDKSGESLVSVRNLLNNHACLACHGLERVQVGPSYRQVAERYQGREDAINYLTRKILQGGQGVWGAILMPPSTVSEAEATLLSGWILKGKYEGE